MWIKEEGFAKLRSRAMELLETQGARIDSLYSKQKGKKGLE